MIQAKFRELGIGNGTPPPSQQINWAMQNQNADLLHLRSLDPSKQLTTPKKMIHPDITGMQPFYTPSPTVQGHIVSSGSKHAFQPVKPQQEAKYTFRHMDSPWSNPATPSSDTGFASSNSGGNSIPDPSCLLSPTSSTDTENASPPFRPISSQGPQSPLCEFEKRDEHDFGYQSPSKKLTKQIQNDLKTMQMRYTPNSSAAVNSAALGSGFAPVATHPMQFTNGLSPFTRFPLSANMTLTRPVVCSPNSSLTYSPLPQNYVPFFTDKGWIMMPADKVGSPMPPASLQG